jgi:hypothetical protein
MEETIHFASQNDRKAHLRVGTGNFSNYADCTIHMAGEVAVLISADQATNRCLTDQVGIFERISLGTLGSLDLVIEKDFACLDCERRR